LLHERRLLDVGGHLGDVVRCVGRTGRATKFQRWGKLFGGIAAGVALLVAGSLQVGLSLFSGDRNVEIARLLVMTSYY